MDLYKAYALAELVNIVTNYESTEVLNAVFRIIVVWLVVNIVRYLTGFYSKYISILVAEKAVVDAEIYSVKHLTSLDMQWHEKENAGNKMKRIDRGTGSILQMVRLWISVFIDMVIAFFGSIIVISYFDFKLVIFILIYQVIYYFIASVSRRKGLRALHKGNILSEEISGLWFEIIANIRSIKVLGMSYKIFEYAKEKTSNYLKTADTRVFWFQGGGHAQGLWAEIVRIGLICYVISGIVQGQYEVGFLVLFYGYFNNLTQAVSQFTSVAQDIATERVNVGRLIEILDEPIRIDKSRGKKNFPSDWQSININNLSFSYGDNHVLKNLNFEIRKGEKVGIVGLSGAGKSTLFKLLLKEHESSKGEIYIGNMPLRMIKKYSYVQNVAAVLQETEVFNLSLKMNVILANSKQEMNTELLDRSLNIAHVNDFLGKLPDGLDTLIGEKGVKLSGGEKQRLGIARAVFKQPQILFLDEATSHLDVESEQKIQDSLHKFFKDVTAVVIAHRLSTIREMDKIIVMEHGRIIETGTFDELYAQSGRFREFWDMQSK